MNLPNVLTLARIFFVPLLVAALVANTRDFVVGGVRIEKAFLAFAIFAGCAATDLLDGYLARRWNQVTTVGILLDPIADKLLISAALISLVQIGRVPGWMAVLIIGREFAVSGLRSIAAAEGYTIQASDLGKSKMLMQVIAVSLAMLAIRWNDLQPWALGAMWAVLLFSLASALEYFGRFWRVLDRSIKERSRAELLELERERVMQLRAERKAARATRRLARKAARAGQRGA
jgi:CDP-diacylglycerol--glycerol-3-phosphate 3-phosphatidyltransferase